MKSLGFGDVDDKNKAKAGPGDSRDQKTSTTNKKVITLTAVKGKKVDSLPSDVEASLKAKRFEIEQEITALDGAPSVSSSVREIRQHHSLTEAKCAVETALVIIKNLLDRPKDPKVYRIKRGNVNFHRCIGRLDGGLLLMRAIGFVAMGLENGDVGPVRADPSSGSFEPSVSIFLHHLGVF